MTKKQLYGAVRTLIVLAIVAATGGRGANAQSSEEPVLRSFLLWLPPGAAVEDCPDVSGTDSLYLIARAGGQEQFEVRFWDHDSQPAALRGTRWIMDNTKLTHVANEETASYPASWESEVASSGARASTGEGDGAIVFNTYRIRRVTTSEDSLANSSLWRVDNGDSGAALVCIGIGLFSK